ncbi:MAG: twin-arginine translocation signal domain-containing protein, partial [Armatimonadota bacterium]
MTPELTRREFLNTAAAIGGALGVGSMGWAERVEREPEKKANEVRPLLFGAGTIWASWLNKDRSYDLRQMDALVDIGGRLTSATFD